MKMRAKGRLKGEEGGQCYDGGPEPGLHRQKHQQAEPIGEVELAAKLLVELTKRSKARTLPSVRLREIVLRRELEISIVQDRKP